MPGAVPATPHAATAAELKAQIEAERDGLPFLIYRDGDGRHRLHVLDEGQENASLSDAAPRPTSPMPWDEEVSRLHAELVRHGDEWTVSDDGLSLNGSFVNGEPVAGAGGCATATRSASADRDRLPRPRATRSRAPPRRRPTCARW